MQGQPPIFISHSSEPDADQAALIDAIKQTFGAEFEILLDEDLLRVGDIWRKELHTWMAICAGAVVILSPGVLKRRDWVLKELTILSWRRSLDPEFVLVPVLLPSVKASNFDTPEFRPHLLSEIQMASGDSAAVIAQLKPVLKPLVSKGPNRVAGLVRDIAANLDALSAQECRDVAAKLDNDPLPWTPAVSAQEVLARRMVHADFTKLCDVLVEVRRRVGTDKAYKILNWLSTYWVDPLAAVPIAEVASGKYRAVALNCKDPLTAPLYVRRALCNSNSDPIEAVITNAPAELTVADVEKQMRGFIRDLYPADVMNRNDESVQRYLRHMGNDFTGQPVFVILDRAVLPDDVVELQTRYPSFTFVLGTETLPSDGYYQSDRVRLLRPELDPDVEFKHHYRYLKTRAALRSNS